MLFALTVILPATACLFAILIHALLAFRVHTRWLVLLLLSALLIFYMADSSYLAAYVPTSFRVWMVLLKQLSAPCVVPLLWLYLNRLRESSYFYVPTLFLTALPTLLVTAGVLLAILAGLDQIEQFYKMQDSMGLKALQFFEGTLVYTYSTWTRIIFRASVSAEILIYLIFLIYVIWSEKYRPVHVYRFLFRGASVSLSELQTWVIIPFLFLLAAKVLFGGHLQTMHPLNTAILSLLHALMIFLFAFLALFGARRTITLRQIGNAFVYNYNWNSRAQVAEENILSLMEVAAPSTLHLMHERIARNLEGLEQAVYERSRDSVAGNLVSTGSESLGEGSLLSRFQHLMVDEQLFLTPGLTLADVAEKLHTNKTYVSKLVNSTYNVGFPELLNTLRVDYAEQYLLMHPEMKQASVAEACGFLSASSFNNIFKRIVGMTPRAWIASHPKNLTV